ncbi:MAG: diadenylate cyclase, partial [Oscillospiraceae bacterium]|nr:diadenylate cyclase [Oscillospiraceae bacterium]
MSLFSELWTSFSKVIDTVRPADFIDIAVVAFIVYKGIKIVRDTRAGQLVKGIIVLAVAYLIALQVGMKTLSFILYNVMQVGLIAVVVVFQPELRRALERVGRTKLSKNISFFAGDSEEEAKLETKRAMIDAVSSASIMLSREKIGALIVFERETKLTEIVNTGTTINADAKAELV